MKPADWPPLPAGSLLVTSSAPTDNKSVAVANLAVAMADGDRPVILVDADLRRPSQHALFGFANEKGFTNLFRDGEVLENPPFQRVANTSLRLLTSDAHQALRKTLRGLGARCRQSPANCWPRKRWPK